jgi:hypothetical protein
LLLLLAAAGLPGERPAEAAVVTWRADLTGAQEVPPVGAGFGSGAAEFFLDDAPSERLLTYFVTVTGIEAGEVTAAHIHRGPIGVNGPVIYPLSDAAKQTAGILYFAGQVKLTEADLTDLRNGNLYVNVHSKAKPGGFARAQLLMNTQAAITSSVRGTVDAWNQKNVERFLAGFTDQGLQDTLDLDPEDAAEFLPMFIGEDPVTFTSLTNVQVSGNTAKGNLLLAVGKAYEATTQSFVLQGGIWKLDASTPADAPIPSGTTIASMKLQEFAFVYDKAQVASGRFAVSFENVGKQVHEVALVKLNTNAALLPLFQSLDFEGPTPEEIEFIGARDSIEPGDKGTLVFTEPLSAGRYAFVCFFPDTDDPAETPHAFKGMLSEFTVSGGTSTVRPPSTGDAGLRAPSAELRLGLAAAGALALIGGLGGVALAARRAR